MREGGGREGTTTTPLMSKWHDHDRDNETSMAKNISKIVAAKDIDHRWPTGLDRRERKDAFVVAVYMPPVGFKTHSEQCYKLQLKKTREKQFQHLIDSWNVSYFKCGTRA
jgi:hypothetical protein